MEVLENLLYSRLRDAAGETLFRNILLVVPVGILLWIFSLTFDDHRFVGIFIQNPEDFTLESPLVFKIENIFEVLAFMKAGAVQRASAGKADAGLFKLFGVIGIHVAPTAIVHEKGVGVVIHKAECVQNRRVQLSQCAVAGYLYMAVAARHEGHAD